MIRREDLPPLPPHPCKPECAERTWECKRSCPRFAAWQAIKDKYEEYGTQEWKRNTLIKNRLLRWALNDEAFHSAIVCEERQKFEKKYAHWKELEKAEAEGRLVVLPCTVGDTVYFRTYAKNATVDLGIQPHKVVTYRLGMVIEGSSGVPETVLPDYEFGRTVFLTREEAEAALKGESNAY